MKLNNLFALIFCVFFASAAFGQQLVFDPKGEKDCIDDCTSDYSVQLEILGAFIDETTSPYSGTPVFNLTLTDEYGNLAEFGSIEFDLEITNYFDDQEVDFENTFTTAGYSQNGCGAFMVQACNIQTMESTVTFYQDLGDFSQLSNNDPIGVNGQGTLVQPGGGTLEPIYAVYTPPVFNDRNLRCPIGYNITISNIVFNDANCDSAFGTGSYPDWYGTAEVYCVEGSVSGSYTYYPQNDNTSDCGGNGGNGRIANSDISDKVQLFPIPAVQNLNIDIDNSVFEAFDVLNASLYNSLGSKVWEEEISSISTAIDITKFDQGYYLLSINNGEKLIYNEKVLVR